MNIARIFLDTLVFYNCDYVAKIYRQHSKTLGMFSEVTKDLISKRKTQISAFKREGCNTVLLEVSN